MNTHTLPNGLKIVHTPIESDVAYCGIAIDAGSRDELESEHGIAHFCEHMMFKGTQKRKAWHILNRMETVGGDLNAYTNKEETVVYSAFVKEHFARAAELICDVVMNSTFPQHEMEKEAEVIADEIESYNDSPAELIFDRFENVLFKKHPLGHDILGNTEQIRNYTSDDAKGFARRMYRPEKMVFFVLGNISFSKVMRTVEKLFDGSNGNNNDNGDTTTLTSEHITHNEEDFGGDEDEQRLLVEHRFTHQAHVMMGCRGYAAKDKRRIALYFLNNIIGGPGMNSRLNIALRERSGLVYTVESTLTNYTDTGTFAIYFGCDPADVKRCLRIVRRELDRLMEKPLTELQMRAYIKQMSGQIRVACDNHENYALDMAKSFLHYGKFERIDETLRHLNSLTPDFVQQVAAETFREDNITIVEFVS